MAIRGPLLRRRRRREQRALARRRVGTATKIHLVRDFKRAAASATVYAGAAASATVYAGTAATGAAAAAGIRSGHWGETVGWGRE